MDDLPILGRDDERHFFNQFAAHYAAPAYMRRAQQVQEAFDQLIARCRQQRDDWLKMVRTLLGLLRALAGDWSALRPCLADAQQVEVLRQLYADLDPQPVRGVETTSSPRALRRALRELREGIERFNRRWQEFLEQVDLSRVNGLREGYNRYYLLEKECAVRSARLARLGYCPLEPLTLGELECLVPLLPVPKLRG
jgi:hypothetical protein